MKTILLSIDIEDYFQVENLRPWFAPDTWHRQQLRVEANTERLLDLFDSFQLEIKATFFVLGWIAERVPGLVREIGNRGHEIASHGYSHMLCNRMDRKNLIADLEKSKKILEDITGNEIRGYRAPNFSINNAILPLIHDSGYLYDSSYNSFNRHKRYGRICINGRSRKGIAVKWYPDFYELPISNWNYKGLVLPWGGGGYFRLFPLAVFISGIHRIINNTGAYLFYLHPWEIDPDQPRIGAKGFSAWRHYLNLGKTYSRLAEMFESLSDCRFMTCREYIDNVDP